MVKEVYKTDYIDKAISFVSPSFVFSSLIVLAFLFVLSQIFYFFGSKNKARRKPGLYKSKNILTPNEKEFYGRMVSALPEYVIHTQIAMSALIEPRVDRMVNGSEYMRLRAKFSQKYVDFVVCRPKSLEVVAIVELDDITHDPEKDALRDEMLEGAFYKVVRWHSRNKPSKSTISKTIKSIDKQDNFAPRRKRA